MYNARPNQAFHFEDGIYEASEEVVKELRAYDVDVILLEIYPGVERVKLYEELICKLAADVEIDFDECYLAPAKLTKKIENYLTTDPVFGKFCFHEPKDLIEPAKLAEVQARLAGRKANEKVIIFGTGVTAFFEGELILYANITRREIEERLELGMGNWQGDNEQEHINRKIKRAYYFEWPFADGIKEQCLGKVDYILDMNGSTVKMVSGEIYQQLLRQTAHRPFRLVPYFASGVWGGHWIQEHFGIGKEEVNIAWGFDGVPEENSLLFQLNQVEFEFPAQDLIFMFGKEVLGSKVLGCYGKEFPIRFDYLDTIGGQNLSLQVHPTTDYAYKKFLARYTQDESYYIMQCEEGAEVYLGVKDQVQPDELFAALREAQATNQFDHQKYISSVQVKRHDHLLIPAGTIHSSGAGCLVLEISATPNRFTFKLWDWDRVDLDGKPRPIHLKHGEANVNFGINETYAKSQLYNQNEIVQDHPQHVIEKTGLHIAEPIETLRESFSATTVHHPQQNVQMVCIVEGEEILVKTITENQEEMLLIHYGETFIIPASVESYTMEPSGASAGKMVKIMKAFVR